VVVNLMGAAFRILGPHLFSISDHNSRILADSGRCGIAGASLVAGVICAPRRGAEATARRADSLRLRRGFERGFLGRRKIEFSPS